MTTCTAVSACLRQQDDCGVLWKVNQTLKQRIEEDRHVVVLRSGPRGTLSTGEGKGEERNKHLLRTIPDWPIERATIFVSDAPRAAAAVRYTGQVCNVFICVTYEHNDLPANHVLQ